jgi:hypothetical protein
VKRSLALLLCLPLPLWPQSAAPLQPVELVVSFDSAVSRRIEFSVPDQLRYAELLATALRGAAVWIDRAQFAVLVDRAADAQVVMIWWLPAQGAPLLIGAAPASTGRPVGFEHFETPLGVFEHSLANPDFRAEGTLNDNGIRGYGDKGQRVYDFGWVMAQRGWAPGEQLMRLQMHSTDRQRLEPRLGERASKGCIRIPASVNDWIDLNGVLDADYEAALAQGRKLWVLRAKRQSTPWSGRYLVVVDSSARADAR